MDIEIFIKMKTKEELREYLLTLDMKQISYLYGRYCGRNNLLKRGKLFTKSELAYSLNQYLEELYVKDEFERILLGETYGG